MARRLEGKRIALTGPRRAEELGKLVENLGGIPLYRPAQGTVLLDDADLRSGIAAWVETPPDWSIFTTGMGLEAVFEMAEDMGAAQQLWENLRRNAIAARGYKTANALKKRQLTPLVRDDDGSTEGLIRGLAEHDFTGKSVMLQLHGDPAPQLTAWLEEQGASCRQVLPYRHIAPPEEALEELLADIVEGKVDAVTFTSGPQVRFLMEHAEKRGRLEALMQALEGPVLAVAVGKVTASGLREAGVPRVLAPKEERMGSMIVELARYYAGEAAPLMQ
ncbi:MAG: uroporphyrinogen-III synthase [Paenibacillus macerans]|uniref:Uroporphyrinogen-III synthase n=1 Tax=Paenibacillus macerans TaxID=44252 RepID=A0A090XZX6_PAEMA|nr:uroporphyrinogen-III synthase [Paenibacillus macerans]KFM91546.1 uroporphyrinogen-III synthase HemD family protein [Paenibacillus macerans]MCY7562761.1 uroporphyrinogen-III synthase [Paenibacillus macerans]MDU7477348.1 uroporphyrinogen-III synthase [Paenibacillus macerans]MEC0138731.1 uroporphyrinogen-III synthase [Paenibacillus macerans]MEC0154198.1 uroporphyrinogen-III synthase [Paenibacillus macerans]